MIEIKRLEDFQDFIDALNMIYEDSLAYQHGSTQARSMLWESIKEFEREG